MKNYLFVSLVFLTLGACASEQEICQNRATRYYYALQRDITSAEKNLSRGYDTKSTKVPYEEKEICRNLALDPRTGRKYVHTHVCSKVKYRTVEEKVPIDRTYERERLGAMKARLVKEQKFAQARLQQCGAI